MEEVRSLLVSAQLIHWRLSFGFHFVASFYSPAWRNWQTRWTQNPVIARSCGFDPLRRHSSLRPVASSVKRFAIAKQIEFARPTGFE